MMDVSIFEHRSYATHRTRLEHALLRVEELLGFGSRKKNRLQATSYLPPRPTYYLCIRSYYARGTCIVLT